MGCKPSKEDEFKVNFNTKHLKKGDRLPPFKDKLCLYSNRHCPFAQRVNLAMLAKQLYYEVINIDLKNKPEWLATKSISEKVPALEIAEGICIHDSLVIVEFLDEVYPYRRLMPKDPVAKALDKNVIEYVASIQTVMFTFLSGPEAITEDHMATFHKILKFLEDELKNRGNSFLGGTKPGYVDYMIWPWIERLLAIKEKNDRAAIDGKKYKRLTEYIDNMLKDPAVSQYMVPKHIFLQILEDHLAGTTPNVDILMEQ